MKAFKLEHNTPEGSTNIVSHPVVVPCGIGEYLSLVSPPGTPSKRSSSVPVPTDQQFSHPIRRYISETLIYHVLGQPSYSLTSLLMTTVSQYLDVPIQFNKPITIEEVCKLVRQLFFGFVSDFF